VVGVADVVGVAVAVGVDVQVGVAVADDVGVPLVVAAGCVPWLNPVGRDVAVGWLAAVLGAVAVAVGVGGLVVSPARDAVGLTFGEPCEPDSSKTATTAMTTAAAAAVIGQRHRRSADGGRLGGPPPRPLAAPAPPKPPVPPGTSRPAAVNGPDATRDVAARSGPRLRSTRVAETESAAAGAGATGSSVVGS
jgi:hypothetical protein